MDEKEQNRIEYEELIYKYFSRTPKYAVTRETAPILAGIFIQQARYIRRNFPKLLEDDEDE